MSPKNSAEQFYLASAGEMSESEHEEWVERKKKYTTRFVRVLKQNGRICFSVLLSFFLFDT